MKPKERESFLKELKQYWLENEIPNVSETNAQFLRDLIKIKQAKRVLEIGTANGYSTIHMAIELEKLSWHIDSIEFSERAHGLATENIKKVELEKTTNLYLWNAIDIIPNLENGYQMIFIDGMKKRTKDFFLLSYDKLETWGIIIIDDVMLFREKMQDLYIYLDEKNIIYNVIPIDVNDWVMLIVK